MDATPRTRVRLEFGARANSARAWLAGAIVLGAVVAGAPAHAQTAQTTQTTQTTQPHAAQPPMADGPAPLLMVTTHTDRVPRFQTFTFQTGSIPGLSASAQRSVAARITAMVERAIGAARAPAKTTCPVGSDPCGIFRQTLRTYACSAGSLCIAQEVGLLMPGMNASQQWVDTLVLDRETGATRPLKAFVPRPAMPAFLAATTAAVRSHLATDGIANNPFWNRPISRRQLRAWVPTRAGMRVWFDKYSAGPGSMGVVQVLVPWVPGSDPNPT